MGLNVEKPFVERRGRRQPRRRHDMAKCIRETLLAFGGEAHRTQVIEQLARDFGIDVRHIPDELRASVIRAFEDVVRDEAKRADFGFHLPFGPGSHRWGVKFFADSPTELPARASATLARQA